MVSMQAAAWAQCLWKISSCPLTPVPVLLVAVVQLPSRVQLFTTPWTASHQASLSLTISQSWPRFMSIDWWCHPAVLYSVALISFCLQSFPASGSFPMSWPFASGDQSIEGSASASILPMSIQGWFFFFPQGWFSLRLTGFRSCCPRNSCAFSNTIQKHQSFSALSSLSALIT